MIIFILKKKKWLADFAVQISEIDVKQPISIESFAVLHEIIDQHAVAVFRNQHIEDVQLVEFAERFGALEAPLL